MLSELRFALGHETQESLISATRWGPAEFLFQLNEEDILVTASTYKSVWELSDNDSDDGFAALAIVV